jgi:hypothetical protein
MEPDPLSGMETGFRGWCDDGSRRNIRLQNRAALIADVGAEALAAFITAPAAARAGSNGVFCPPRLIHYCLRHLRQLDVLVTAIPRTLSRAG